MPTEQGMLIAEDLKAELAKIDDNAVIIGWKNTRDTLTLEFAYIHRKPSQFFDIHIQIGETREIKTEKFPVGKNRIQ